MEGLRVKGAEPTLSSASKEEAAMDTYLRSKGLYRKKIAKDGSCLFRAVAEQVLHSQARHLEVRKSCIKYLRENRTLFEAFIEGSFDEYLKRLENPQEWVGQVEISALSLMFKKEFVIYQEPDVSPAHVTDNGFTEEIILCFSNGNHYDIIYPSGYAENAALCQSIIYELLYEKVLGVNVTKNMLKTEAFDWKVETFDSDTSGSDGDDDAASYGDNVNFVGVNGFKPHKDGKSPQIKESNSVVSAAALQSLNPAVFRNVEYGVWMKSQRDQQRMDFTIAAGMQYSVGDKCKVQLEYGGTFYNAHIQEVVAENGPAVVFVEELGERKVVPLKNLKPVPLTVGNNDGWSTVAGKKLKKSCVSGPVVQFEKDGRGQKSLAKPHKTQSVPSPRQQASGSKQPGLPADQTVLSENKGQSKTPKVPGRRLDRERGEESSFHKKESVHFGLTPEERREKQVIEESKSLYEMQNRDTEAFPTLAASLVDATATSSDVKKNPMVNREKSARGKSEDDQKTKAPKLAQPATVDDQKPCEEMKKPPATSDEIVVIPDVTVLPTPAEQQTPTTVPSQPPVVTPWSGILAQAAACEEAAPDSAELQPQVTSTFSPLPVSMPAVSQHLLPMPQTLSLYQDPLYPGFPVNEKGERITSPPPYSYCKNGDDLPNDKSILHFFYNLGIKAYTCPMWPPHLYLHPLHQAYLNVCRIYPNIPVYPQNSWMQDTTVNQNEPDPSLSVHQNEVRNDNQVLQPAILCSSLPLAPSVQTSVAGQVPSQINESEDQQQFQPGLNDFEGAQPSETIFPQPHFGQASYMGHLPVAPQVFPQVWYGYPYQGYVENPVVQHNVFITPQSTNVPDNTLSVDVAESHTVERVMKQPQELVNESRPDQPLSFNVVATEEPGLNSFQVKPGPQIILDRPEIYDTKSLLEKVLENQVSPSVVSKTPEERRSSEDKVYQLATVTASVNPPEDRPIRAKEESSEDEREVSNILSGGRSKNFYNQSYGSRRFRNEKFHQPNRGGYQYSRNEDAWRGARGREDGYPQYRNYRGRPNRRRPMGDPYRQYHE